MGNTQRISLKVIDGDVQNIEYEKRNLRIAILQMLCLENLYKKEADHDKRGDESINGNETLIHDEIEPFQKKFGLNSTKNHCFKRQMECESNFELEDD